MHLILSDGFWFEHIPFGSMIKFKSLAQFPVEYLYFPVVPSVILLLYQCAVWAYYMGKCFIFFSTLDILLCLIDFCFKHNCSLCRYFVQLCVEIQFCSLYFLFVAMFMSSRMQSRYKYPYSCFPSLYISSFFVVFLSVVLLTMPLLAALINLSLFF